jgi:hypothetical protein
MLLVEILTACIPGYVAVAIGARTWLHKRRHSRCLASIARLERELFPKVYPDFVAEFNKAIHSGAWAKSQNYTQGVRARSLQEVAENWSQAASQAGMTYTR